MTPIHKINSQLINKVSRTKPGRKGPNQAKNSPYQAKNEEKSSVPYSAKSLVVEGKQ